MTSPINAAAEKKKRITKWAKSVIGIETAKEQGLVQLSALTFWRNWTCREALFDMWEHNQFAQLVQIDPRRYALFAKPSRPPLA